MDAADPPPTTVAIEAPRVRLALYPGERVDADGVTRGHVYVHVDDRLVTFYPAACGPPPGSGWRGDGGHDATPTPAGEYVLGFPERHITPGWPASVVPWGAPVRERPGGEIEYSPDGARWIVATGGGGVVTRAVLAFVERTRAGDAAEESRRTGRTVRPDPITEDDVRDALLRARALFLDEAGRVAPVYQRNDFGPWAFDLWQGGAGTAFYVHTTPGDEAETAAGREPRLPQSHGCIHVRPADRDEAMQAGYLQQGVRLVVMPYGLQGP
jgi:hypothetical protein